MFIQNVVCARCPTESTPQQNSTDKCVFFLSQAPANSTTLDNYHKGVQMGCWGLVIYAMTAATCSGNQTQAHII